MKKLILMTLLASGAMTSVARATIPDDCKFKIVTSDSLNFSNPANIDIVDPKHIGDPKSLMNQHINYMNSLLKNKELLATGAVDDLNGRVLEGFTVFNTEDLKVAEALTAADPFVINKVIKVEYKRWRMCR